MKQQQNIQKKAEGFGKLAPVFIEGAEFAMNNLWISVNDDLPCNHNQYDAEHRKQTRKGNSAEK